MKTAMISAITVVFAFILCIPVFGQEMEPSASTVAGASSEYDFAELVERGNYNLALVTEGVRQFYWVNGWIPDSLQDVVDAGFIPSNMVNPVTGERLNTNSRGENLCDVYYEPAEHFTGIIVTCLAPNGLYMDWDVEFVPYGSTTYTGPDLVISHYYYRIDCALECYWRLYKHCPQSQQDLIDTGFWPFDGTELNPVSHGLLYFYGREAGDLRLEFLGDEVRCHYYMTNDRFGCTGFSDEAGIEIFGE